MYCYSHLLDSQALAMRWAKSNEGTTEIITSHGIYYSNYTPIELLEIVCIQSSSTLAEKMEGSKPYFEHALLPPYMCSPDLNAIQTSTIHNFDCVWLFNENFTVVESDIDGHTLIYFGEDIQLIIPAPIQFIEQQRILLHELKKYFQKSSPYLFPCPNNFDQFYH